MPRRPSSGFYLSLGVHRKGLVGRTVVDTGEDEIVDLVVDGYLGEFLRLLTWWTPDDGVHWC